MRHGCASGVMLLLLGTVGAQGAAPPTRNHWTLLFYGAGADEKHVLKTVGVMKDHFVDGQGVELIALINRPGKYADASKVLGDDFAGTRVFRVTRGRATRLTAPFAAGVKTAEPTTLQKFIRFARANHPAQRYALIFFGHGNGWRFCPDKESGTALQPTAVSAALGRDDSVDLVVFDVCFMGGIEVAYQWRPGNGRFQASAMVAAPGLGDALPYDAILSRLHSGGLAPARLTPLALGKQIVADTDAHRRREIVREPMYASEVLACYDLSHAAAVKEAVDALAVADRGGAGRPGEGSWVGEEAGGDELPRPRRGGAGVGVARRPVLRPVRPRPAGPRLTRLPRRDQGQGGRRPARRGAAHRRLVRPEGVSRVRAGQERAVHHLPRRGGPDKTKRHWEYCRWYTPLTVRGDKNLYGRWAWCRDGATAGNGRVENWFELMDSWYDTTNDETGGLNGYRW